jgi:hypothetical protein
MADRAYMNNRRKYQRPQALLFSNYPGTIDDCFYMLPNGPGDESSSQEFGYGQITDQSDPTKGYYSGYNVPAGPNFLVCSDDNRSSIQLDFERIESRERMINGRMRSVFIDDKLKLSVSWDMLPSRAFDGPFYSWGIDSSGVRNGTIATIPLDVSCECGSCFRKSDGSLKDDIKHLYSHKVAYTTDGGAGGNDLLKWYKEHPGPFWVYLAYDNWDHFNTPNVSTGLNFPWDKCHYKKYSHRLEMYFSSFDYSIEKRGNYDFWNVSMNLEEV